MAEALRLAARGRGSTSPNPMVGAVVVSPRGTVVGRGYHERAGEPHAEVHALDEAGERALGATLYCTQEPCCHVGRTGPCVDRIVAAGVSRVVAAMEDPNPLVHGGGFAALRRHGVRVEVGIGGPEARRLNRPFVVYISRSRPFVIMKVAVSADNRVAAAAGSRTAVTSDAARRHVHRLRTEIDAIGVGAGTVLVDDPVLTTHGEPRRRPLTRVVFDRRLRMPRQARLLSTLAHGPVIIVTSPEGARGRPGHVESLRRAGAIVQEVPGGLGNALRWLARERGIMLLLVEGGPTLHASFWEAGLVDQVQQYRGVRTLGDAGVPWLDPGAVDLEHLADRRVLQLGSDTLIEGYVHRID